MSTCGLFALSLRLLSLSKHRSIEAPPLDRLGGTVEIKLRNAYSLTTPFSSLKLASGVDSPLLERLKV